VEVLQQAIPIEEERMKFSVATISLPNLNIPTAAAEIRAAGFEGVEWRVEPRGGSIPDRMPAHPFLVDNRATIPLDVEAARDAARITRDHHLALVGLGAYIELDDYETLDLVLDMAIAADVGQIRMQAPRPSRTGMTYSELFERFRTFFAGVEERALATGVSALLEIHHKTICPSAALAYRVLESLDSGAVGAIYDVGNLVWEGYVDHSLALDQLGPYLRHVHLKNAANTRRPDGGWEPIWTPLEDGIVDVPAFLALLEERGYSGWVSLEELSLDRSPSLALRHNAAQLREWRLLADPTL